MKIMKFKASAVGLVTLLLALSLVTPNSSIAQGALQKATVLEVQDGDTIDVRFEDGRREPIRYVGISAPELDECFGPEAKGANEQLVLQKEVWLDPETTDSVHVRLTKSGHLRLDPREVKDRDVRDNPSFSPVRYSEQIIAAQIAAAGQRLGWWGECDPYRSSDLAIAAIKFWGDEEIAYIVNRGNQPIDIGQGWEIRDSTESERNRLKFNTITGQPCLLPAGGLLRIHSGSGIKEEQRKTSTPCNQSEIDIYWTGNTIWDNDGDKARLFNPEGTLVYEYVYPPRGP
ncbi:MAG: hypothetical protein A2Z21_01585 [Candidatus Fraserbacteria bacterium RBG_16_55_9]|uniref:TNase-like domain-containing protein n=1 Tax=Fraserbacteria sp. (strain RBG_16_55_9) TaxID=1817864 RepID=A0A1F5UWX0_FRAXR|nr:MAG: hypothetical protein A2Z21_01585 [Candidatus Fraserbacteria bacterium RBG_16_55_9]